MTRPVKATADYFPHFVSHGKTINILESKWGNDGYAFWFKLLEILARSEHHFINCNETADWEYLLTIVKVEEEIATQILNMLAKLDAIVPELWENKIIRSDNFIKNLSDLYSRRTINPYSNETILSLCIQKPVCKGISDNINPQRIEKNSIVENSIEKLSVPDKPKKNKFIVSQMLSMTEEEYNKLVLAYGKEIVDDKIEYSRNYAKLKTYTSLYLTLNKWLKNEDKRNVEIPIIENGAFKI